MTENDNHCRDQFYGRFRKRSALQDSQTSLWMEITMATVLVGAFLPLVSMLLFWWRFMLPPSPRLPPGPRPLPIVGNLLQMRRYPSIQDFANELKRQYGPIVTLWMCSKPIVIISGPDIIQEAMIGQGNVFRARHQLESISIIYDGHRSITSVDWARVSFIRKLMVSGVMNSKRVAPLRPIRERVLDILVDSLKRRLDDNGGVVSNFRSLVRLTTCNLIAVILFGRGFTQEEYELLDELMVERFQLALGTPRDFMPWLAWLPNSKSVKNQLEHRGRLSRILEPLIDERKQALKSGTAEQAAFVDTLLGLREGQISSPIEILDSDVELICINVLAAGTDTTALNLEFCIANLINHPEVQQKLAWEISAVVGSDRAVNEDDIPLLPFLQAVVKESLRRHSPARLAPFRKAISATTVAGYDIPANTLVLQHLEAVSLSPEIWEDPLEFRPERFLNRKVDITGSTEMTMVPFGVGRRICPAINVAFLHGELILARLIQEFECKPATPGERVDLTPGGGLTAPMKHPLVLSLQRREMVS